MEGNSASFGCMRCCSVSLGKRTETVAGHACVNAVLQNLSSLGGNIFLKTVNHQGHGMLQLWPLCCPNSDTLGSQALRWSSDSAAARRMQSPQGRVLLEVGLHERQKFGKMTCTDNLDCPSPCCPWAGTTTRSNSCTPTSCSLK